MKIALINMPFADIRRPSIALAQLRSVIHEHFGDVVEVKEFFLNMDMAELVTPEVYEFISGSGASNDTGFGDWFFRQEAFPELKDNTKEYFERYQFIFGEEAMAVYDTKLRDKRSSMGQTLQQWILGYRLHEYDIVGFTSMFMQNVPSFALARNIRLLNPAVTIIMGGANCESPMGEEIVRNIEYVDYVFSGTALKSLPQFINNYLLGEHDKSDRIDGVFSKRNSVEAMVTGPVGDERPVSEVVKVEYDDFLEEYTRRFPERPEKPYLLFETSRGCWWGAKAHCTFCGLNGGNMAYRAIPPSAALEYIGGLFDRYACRVDHFSSVDNIIPKEYFTDVFPHLDVPDNVTIFYEVKADLTREQMAELARTHVAEIQPGIESLNTATLKLMRKGTTSFGNVRLLKHCVTYKIRPIWNLLIGFPGEKEETYEKYADELRNLYHLPPPSGVFPVRFDRYSPYFTKAKEYALDLHPLDYYYFIYPFDNTTLAGMAYYFSDHNYDAAYITSTAKWLDTLRQIIREWGAMWKNTDGRPKLFISRESGQPVVNDSRNGYLVRYRLNDTAMGILDSLDVHKSRSALIDDVRHLSPEEVNTELEWLIDNGLIFEEKGSLMSLVLPDSFHAKQESHKEVLYA
jgi:ribosomal peptide maturation radical SAM protein 1